MDIDQWIYGLRNRHQSIDYGLLTRQGRDPLPDGYRTIAQLRTLKKDQNMTEFKITKPGSYKQRDGGKAIVEKLDTNVIYGVKGVDPNGCFRAWRFNGNHIGGQERPQDIIAPWFEIDGPGDYKTRDGRKVTIVESCSLTPAGYVWRDSRTYGYSAEGRWTPYGDEQPYDIISKWESPMKIDLSKFDSDISSLGICSDGQKGVKSILTKLVTEMGHEVEKPRIPEQGEVWTYNETPAHITKSHTGWTSGVALDDGHQVFEFSPDSKLFQAHGFRFKFKAPTLREYVEQGGKL